MSEAKTAAAPRRHAGLRLALFWQHCDRLSGGLLCLMVVFSPWAFGSATPWAITTLNVAGYTLGALLVLKLCIRWFWHYQPPRWDDKPANSHSGDRRVRWMVFFLAGLTAAILLYCAVSAINARSSYDMARRTFDYHSHVSWLPHSYDRNRSVQYLLNYLALAWTFWAARDWLLGRTMADRCGPGAEGAKPAPGVRMPARLGLLLWVLSLNGALLAGEALAQRWSGTDKLLWLVLPRDNANAEDQLGPFNYRSNGAQYLNLIWPVTLGLWWRLRRAHRETRSRQGAWQRHKHHVLLACVLLMSVTPVLSLSRGGLVISIASMLAALLILWIGWRHHSVWPRLGLLVFFCGSLWLGWHLGGAQLAGRLADIDDGYVQREKMFEPARAIARDYPLFGTGPGTFGPVFQLYRRTTDEYWPAQLHNDWLETRITFGWLGSALIGLAFLAVVARYFLPGGAPTGWRMVLLIWVALLGCLLHARWDFPFQVYSILFLFLLHCAVLSVLSRRTLAAA